MKALRKEIVWILVFKVIVLTALWYVCFSKPALPKEDSHQIVYEHVY